MITLKKDKVIQLKPNLVKILTIFAIFIFLINLQNVLRNYFAIYGTNDDYLLNSMLDGKYSGSSNYYVTHIKEALSFFLSGTYKLLPNVPVYGIFLLILLVVSLIVPILVQFNQNNNYNLKLLISWCVSSIFITNWFVLNPTFTAASIMISSLGYLMLFIQINNKFSNRHYFLISLFLLTGYLLRVEGFNSSSLIWLPLIVVSLGYQTLRKKIDYKVFFNKFTFLASIIPILLVTFSNLSVKSEWRDFYEFNAKREMIVDSTRIIYLESNKTKLNIEDALLTNLKNFTLIDKRNYNSEILDDLIAKSNSSQGISGLINPVVDVQFRIKSLYKFGGLSALILLLPLASSLISTRNRIYYFHLGLIISLVSFSFYFLLATAKIEERVVIPLVLNLWFFAFAFLDKKQVKSGNRSLFLFLSFTVIFLSIFNKHVHHPTYFKERSKWNQGAIEFSKQQRTILSQIGEDATFVGPISAIRLNWISPYEVSQAKDPNFISFGWHTFSPTWFEKNQRLFRNEDSILDNLINNSQTYLVSDPEIADSLFSSDDWRNNLDLNPRIVSSIGTIQDIHGGPYNVYSLNPK